MSVQILIIAGSLVLLGGCGFGSGTLDDVDPEAAPMQPTYQAHVAPIMTRYCTACHASDAQPGEVEGYGYETCDKVRRNWRSIEDTVFEKDNMPPGLGRRVTEPERLALQRWWDQGGMCD